MSLIDTHAHIYSSKFDADRDLVVEDVINAGVTKVFMPNVDVDSIDRMLDCESRYPGLCLPMMGLHPCEVGDDFEEQLRLMEGWLERRPFAGIGEIGTDLYWDKTNLQRQIQALDIQVSWAKSLGLPIVLHCRESMDITIDAISQAQDGNLRGIFHCFTGTLEQAKKIIDLGFLLGIGGVVTFKNGGLDQVIPYIGTDALVLETDAPYLAPVPHRGKRNSPAFLPFVAEKVAEILQVKTEEVAKVTSSNALGLFKEIEL